MSFVKSVQTLIHTASSLLHENKPQSCTQQYFSDDTLPALHTIKKTHLHEKKKAGYKYVWVNKQKTKEKGTHHCFGNWAHTVFGFT